MGYNPYYDVKLTSIQGLANYSGTRADKEFWAHDPNDTEKEILRIKAHERQISSVSLNKGQSGSTTAGSVDGDGNPKSKLVRSRHNKCQHELYNKHKKAKKAQLAKQTVNNNNNNNNKAPAAAATPPKAGL